jgi:hypothetical protein
MSTPNSQPTARPVSRARSRAPAIDRAYLADPNYYRLSYQLAAQRLNDALGRKNANAAPVDRPVAKTDEPDTETTLEQQRRDVERELARVNAELGEKTLRRDIELAQKNAEELTAITQQTINAIDAIRETRNRWRRRQQPTPQQRRLRRFLTETVHPCATLVSAGAIATLGATKEAEKRAKPIRDGVTAEAFSYRAAYNLACYELASSGETTQTESWAFALDALQIALREAPSQRQRTALIAWARKDPALAPISEFNEFEDLLERHAVPVSIAAANPHSA